MKKRLLFLAGLVLITGLATLNAQRVVLSESFEWGIPASWHQVNIKGDVQWQTESSSDGKLAYPATAYNQKSRAYLRNTTGQSLGYVTRLLTPQFNLEGVYQPLLRFAWASPKWTADFDTLRVYYKNSTASSAPWVLLKEYAYYANDWQFEEIELPNVTSTYQIAFEGAEHVGRGIVLDQVVVRSKPQCIVPHDLYTSNMVDGNVTVSWLASYDAYAFEALLIKGGKQNLDTLDFANSELIVELDTILSPKMTKTFSGLEGNQKYTVYVRSLCDEPSDWGSISFDMKMVYPIPFYEGFDYPVEAGIVRKPVDRGWTCGNNFDRFAPYMPVGMIETEAAPYMHGTTGSALAFAGRTVVNGYKLSTGDSIALAPKEYAWAITPELTGKDLRDCQVRFWMGLGPYGAMSNHAKSVIVGIVEDPEDLSAESFTAIDTITMTQSHRFEEYVVSFEKYEGKGKQVAFVSAFNDKWNVFFLDDIYVEPRPELAKPVGLTTEYTGADVTLKWDKVEGATSYNLVVSTELGETPESVLAKSKVVNTNVTTNSYVVSEIEAGKLFFYYVQAVKGDNKGLWSNAYDFYTYCGVQNEQFYDFEADNLYSWVNIHSGSTINNVKCVATYSTDADFPHAASGSTYAFQGTYYFTNSNDRYKDAYVVFPPVDRVDTMQIDFYMRAYSTTYYAQVVVGVMTNPNDMSTFEPIATQTNTTNEYNHYIVPLVSYTGKGQFIAIKWGMMPEANVNNYPAIDNVSIKYAGDCLAPTGIEMTSYSLKDSVMTISWETNGMSEFDVFVTNAAIPLANLATFEPNAETFFHKEGLKTNSVEVSGVDWGIAYYVYVRAVCDRYDADFITDWVYSGPIVLPAPTPFALPYEESFDVRWRPSGYPAPFGWSVIRSGNYPYVYNTTTASYLHSAPNSIYMYNYSGSTATSKCGLLIAPELDIDDMNDLAVTFWAKASSVASATYVDSLYVGVMSDPTDASTVTYIDTISVPITTYAQYGFSLDGKYQPSMGKHIVFTTYHATKSNTLYLDDIVFASLIDIAPFDITATDVTNSSAKISWEGKATQGWQVVVATALLDETELANLSENAKVVYNKETQTKDITIDGLATQMLYYVYVKAIATEKWCSAPGFFFTPCGKLIPSALYVQDFEEPLIDYNLTSSTNTHLTPSCWTSRNENPNATTTYIPGIYRYLPTATSTANVHGGSSSFYLYASTTYGPSILVTPEIAAKNMSNVTVSFWAKPGSATYKMEVGVMTNPEDSATFTLLYDWESVVGTAYDLYEVPLAEYGYQPAMGNYIAFRTKVGATAGIYIDDITITENSCVKPRAILSRITSSTVRVATGLENSDNVRIVLAKDTIFDEDKLNGDNAEAYIASLGDKVVRDSQLKSGMGEQLEGLQSSTSYAVALLHTCGDEGSSLWRTSTFQTLCEKVQPNLVETFESIHDTTVINYTFGPKFPVDCWITGNKKSITNYIPYVVRNNLALEGTKSLVLYSLSSTDGAYAIMPELDIDDITKYQVDFLGRANGGTGSGLSVLSTTYAAGIIVGVVSDASDISTFVAVDTIFVPTNDVYDFTVDFSSYKGDADGNYGKYVAFLSEFGKTNIFYIDSVKVSEIAACGRPATIKVNAGETTADISWASKAETFNIYITSSVVKTSELTAEKALVYIEGVKANNYKVTGLPAGENLYAYVSSICDGVEKFCSVPVAFATECAEYMDLSNAYVQSFDDLKSGSGNRPNCWVAYYNNMEKPTYPYVYSTYKHGATGNSFYFYSYSTYADPLKAPTIALPKIADLSKVMISFYGRSSITSATGADATITLGYSTDISSIEKLVETYTPIDTIVFKPFVTGSDWTLYEKQLTDFVAKDAYLVLQTSIYQTGVSTGSVYIDDLRIERIPTCFVPRGLSVVSTSDSSASFELTPYKEDDKAWDIMVVNGDDAIVRTFNTTTIEFDGLKGSTPYQVFARTNCGDGDVSDWTSTNITFSTKYSIEGNTDLFMGFETSEPSQLNHPNASTQMLHSALEAGSMSVLAQNTSTTQYSYIPYNYTSVATEGYRSRTGSGVLYFYSYPASSATATYSFDHPYVLLPAVKDATIKRQLRFDVRSGYVTNDTVLETNTYKPNMIIGYVDADAELPTLNATDEKLADVITPIYTVKMTNLPLGQKVIEANNYMFDQVVVELPDMVGKRPIIMLKSVGAASYAYLDNLYVQESAGFNTPQIKSKSFDGNSVTINWNQAAGAKYNVYIVDDNDAFPFKNVKAENIVAQQLNVDGNSATIAGLVPGKTYSAYLQIAGIDDIAAVSARTTFFMPNEGVIAPDSIITFDTNLKHLFPRSATAADTAYLTMEGMLTGSEATTSRAYQGRIIEKGTYYTSNSRSTSYANYSYGMEQSNALYFYSGYLYPRPYAVFTNKIASTRLDTMQVQFYARLGYENVSTNKLGVAITETYRAVPIIVGAMADPNDFSTFEPIAEIFYPENVTTSVLTTDDANQDEKGNSLHYFRKFEAPLKNLGDRYLAFTIAPRIAAAYWSIDNVSFGKVGCLKPISLTTTDITATSAVIRWESQISADNVLQVSTEPTFAAEALLVDTVITDLNVDSLVLSGLKPITTYYWRIRSLCDADAGEYSDWNAAVPFTTECVAVNQIGHVFTFEEEQGIERVPGATSDTYLKPMCWTVGTSATSSAYFYYPRVHKSTATVASAHLQYSEDTEYINEYSLGIGEGSNYRSSSSSNYARQWAISPELEYESYDSLQLTFYMLPARYNRNTNKISTSYCAGTTSVYAYAIIVGTIDDVDNIESFMPIDTIRYSRAELKVGDLANYDNDWMFQKITVPLKGATGKHIVFYSDIDAFISKYPDLQEQFESGKSIYNHVNIDDVTIEKIKECPAVSGLSVSDVTASSALFSWNAEEDVTYNLSVFTDVSLTQLLVDTILDTNSFLLTGLDEYTEYYWYVQKLCTEGAVSELGDIKSFHTLRRPYVQEQFLVSVTPEDWTTSNARALSLFNHAEKVERPTGTTTWTRTSGTTASQGIGGGHVKAPLYSTTTATPSASTISYSYFGWLISPEIELDSEHDAWLTVKLALTEYATTPVLTQPASQEGWDDQFIIAISLDGGKTFERENAEIWNNETSNDPTDSLYIYGKGDHVLNDLPMEVSALENPTYKMDLSKYKGQRIKIGFYHESTVINARNYIHVGQFRVNYYAKVDADITACQFEELSLNQTNGFNINEDKIGAGVQEFERLVLYQTYMTDNVEKLDSIYTLKAEILEATTTVTNEEICEGEQFLFGNVAYSQTGEYKLKGICSETGCDSIAILNLVVNPRVYTEVYDTICAGQTYTHHGKEFKQSVVFTDTLSNQLGCDSIVTLYLYQIPIKRYQFEKQICSGNTFFFTEKYPELNLSGVYVDTVQTTEGCDSIITLDLKVVDVITNRIEVKQCINEPYTFDGYTFEQGGEQQFTYSSTQGCDSIVTVAVEYMPIYNTPIDVAICQGETFTLNDVEYTTEGQFTQELKSVDGCDSILTINITYKEEVAIYVDTIISIADLPYFYEVIEYPKTTDEGEYFDTIYNYNGDCAITLYHHLTIIGGTYIIENNAGVLTLAPSIISAGESVRVLSDFSKDEMRGMTVAVYDMVGRRVAYEKLTEPKQIVLNYFNTAGVYTVRLTNAQGDEFIGRVVVK